MIPIRGKTMNKTTNDEKIGYHKGALSTLIKEREELLKIVNIVEQLMQVHIQELKALGIDLEAIAKEQKKTADESRQKAK
ncbi:MAG: hypothetical protein QW594_04210 [Candidatus Woesearchaeota archaeon]